MVKKILFTISVFFFASLVNSSFALARISVLNRTGEISIGMPDNKIIKVGPDDSLPVLPDNAVITILSGSADISASEPSAAKVISGGYTADVGAGNALSAGVDAQTKKGIMILIYGLVPVTGSDGSRRMLDDSNPSLETVPIGQQDQGNLELPSVNEVEIQQQGNSHFISHSN